MPNDSTSVLTPMHYVLLLLLIITAMSYLVYFLIRLYRYYRYPRQTVDVRVKTLRLSINNLTSKDPTRPCTSYAAVFEIKGGGRLDLPLTVTQYETLVEGEVGTLTYRGTHFIRFERR